MTTENEIRKLESLYEGTRAWHGELHDHAATGGTSDGKCTLAEWTRELKEKKMDFAAILDHRQVRHMYLSEWKDGLFIGGTEPGTAIIDIECEKNNAHYNMIFEGPKPLEALLAEFPEYEFTGGPEGHFKYPKFTLARFRELIAAVKAHGGFFVYPHPKQLMKSEDPLDYWFADETGIEVFYVNYDSEATRDNYALWTALLAAGKRVWACAGNDEHNHAHDTALTTIFASAHANAAYLEHLRVGDFTCGGVGVRMCLGGAKSGGHTSFAGGTLTVSVSDFHESLRREQNCYRLDILDDRGLVRSEEIRCTERSYVSIPARSTAFYRAEVWDTTRGLRIAVGNPIWNDDAPYGEAGR